MQRTMGLFSLLIASGAFAQPNSSFPIDLHANNRAIAFGSALMVTDNKSDPGAWKKVEAVIGCSSNGNTGSTPPPPDASGKPVPPINCFSTVYYVTHYSLLECPDGRVSILRSGEGVVVESPHQGSFFGWAEHTACDVPVKPMPIPVPGEPAQPEKDRPLDFMNITRSID